MQDLTLVGVHDDGEHLVLSGADGQRFRVRVDESLRAAVRRDRARLGQLQIEIDGRMRPRDIQARIRAGHSAEEVAEEAGLPLEHVRRFEGPVLAEREFVARQARGVRVRRAGTGTQPTLGELVSERLARREVEDDAAVWDAYRRDDGQWVVTLSFPAGGRGRTGSWTYDPQLRHVVPLDDEARWLTEDDAPDPAPGPRRLAPVPDPQRPARPAARESEPAPGMDPEPRDGSAADDDEDEDAVPAHAPVHAPAASNAASTAASTVELLDSLRGRRGRRPQRPLPDEEPDLAADDPVERALARADADAAAAHPSRSRGVHPAEAEVLHLAEAEPADDALIPEPVPGATPAARADVAREDPLPKAAGAANERGGNRKNRRASVPSWDDIVFGSRRE